MAAKRLDFTKSSNEGAPCEQGATFRFEMTWKEETAPGSNVYEAVNLTGFTAKMQVRKKTKADPLIIELNSTPAEGKGTITLGGAAGTITLVISATLTAGLAAGVYQYDLELTNTNVSPNEVTRFIEGYFEVVGEITT